MKIVECRVIRPKDRRSVVLAAAELLFDNGIRVVNMHLLKPREGQEGNQLRMPVVHTKSCLLYTSPSPRDRSLSRMPSSA